MPADARFPDSQAGTATLFAGGLRLSCSVVLIPLHLPRPVTRAPALSYRLQSLQDTRLYLLAFSLASVAASGAVAALLVCRAGRRLGLRLMYLLAALPGVVVLQVGSRVERLLHRWLPAPFRRLACSRGAIGPEACMPLVNRHWALTGSHHTLHGPRRSPPSLPTRACSSCTRATSGCGWPPPCWARCTSVRAWSACSACTPFPAARHTRS